MEGLKEGSLFFHHLKEKALALLQHIKSEDLNNIVGLDIGPDFLRRSLGRDPSPFYNMERSQVKGYENYKKSL